MGMPRIFTIGETIYDIIFSQGQPAAAKAGGSMLNSAVSLGRCGLPVEMISEIGDDHLGVTIRDFLNDNGVGTSFTQIMKGRKTPVALAFLDDHGNATYSFYKDYPAQRLRGEWPVPEKDDIVLFGSFYSLDAAIRDVLLGFLLESRENGAILIYDPNIRKNHISEIRKLMPRIGENISLAHLVRGSDEDFQNIFGLDDVNLVFNSIRSLGCPRLIVTKGKHGVEMITDGFRFEEAALPVEVISTIGAGDSFNAGLIHALAGLGTGAGQLDHLSVDSWQIIVREGIRFSAEVCASFDNYIAKRISG